MFFEGAGLHGVMVIYRIVLTVHHVVDLKRYVGYSFVSGCSFNVLFIFHFSLFMPPLQRVPEALCYWIVCLSICHYTPNLVNAF